MIMLSNSDYGSEIFLKKKKLFAFKYSVVWLKSIAHIIHCAESNVFDFILGKVKPKRLW